MRKNVFQCFHSKVHFLNIDIKYYLLTFIKYDFMKHTAIIKEKKL